MPRLAQFLTGSVRGVLHLRPLSRSDFADVLALHLRAEEFDRVPRVLTLDELEEELDDEHVSLATTPARPRPASCSLKVRLGVSVYWAS